MEADHHKRTRELFELVSNLPDSEQAARLESEPDIEVREEVRALLAAVRRLPTEFLSSEPRNEFSQPGVGASIGPYILTEKIGEGGMGEVFRAEQHKPIQRTVALKLIKAGLDTREVLARFDAEREVLSRLDHPNIAKVLDAGTSNTGRPYFVVELVPGLPITQFCDENRISIPDRLRLFTQVCQAIAHAHTKGIIHRDIKPGNILAFMQEGIPSVKVIDFGIAKALRSGHESHFSIHTSIGQALGTYEYMSPEQAEGSEDVDTRSDVYALGVLLYELLAGCRPFDRSTLGRAADEELRRIIREVDPPQPGTRFRGTGNNAVRIATFRQMRPEQLSRELNRELGWIPLTAMRKDRLRRYQTPLALAADVHNYLLGKPLTSGPDSRWYRLQKFAWRHRRGLCVSAGIVILFSVAGLIYVRDLTRERARTAEEQQTTQTINEFLNGMLASADPAVSRGKPLLVVDAVDRAAERIGGQFEGRPRVEASLRLTLGKTYLAIGFPEKALHQLNTAAELATKSLGTSDKLTLQIDAARVKTHLSAGLLSQALSLANTCFARSVAVLGPDDDTSIQLGSGLAASQIATGDYKSAVATSTAITERSRRVYGLLSEQACRAELQQALAVCAAGDLKRGAQLCRDAKALLSRVLGEDHPETIRITFEYGDLLANFGRFSEAQPMLSHAVDLARRVMGPAHPETMRAILAWSVCLRSLARNDEADALLKEATQTQQMRFGDDHPDTLACQFTHARLLQLAGKFSEADAEMRSVLDRRRAVLGPEHPDTLDTASAYSWLLGEQYKFKEAREMIGPTLAAARRVLGEDHPVTIGALGNYAIVMDSDANPEEADQVFVKLIECTERVYGPESTQASGLYNNYGGFHQRRERGNEALAMHQKALAARTRLFGPDHFWVYQSCNQIALALKLLGRLEEAEGYAKRSWEGQSRTRGPEHSATLNAMNTYALTLYEQGKYEPAEPLFRAALEARWRLYGRSDPSAWAPKVNLGTLLLVQNRPAEAEPLLREAYEQFCRDSGMTHPGTVKLARKLANCLDRLGRPADGQKVRDAHGLTADPVDWTPAPIPKQPR